MLKKIILAHTMAISFALATPLYADGSPHCGCMLGKMKETLNLTPAQEEKMKALKDQSQAAVDFKMQQLKTIKHEINALVMSDSLDESKLDTLLNQKKDVQASLTKTRLMTKHQMYLLLDPQQKAKFIQMVNKK